MAADPLVPGLEGLPEADQTAIVTTLSGLLTAFSQRDADALNGVSGDDADWVNAFGTVKKGGPAIVGYLRGLFADANFNRGTMAAPPESTLRVLTPEVITVSTHLKIEGQGLVGGSEIPVRDNFSLRVVQRQPDGRWVIVSEMYMDARTDETYAAGP
jgi:uncharacterized protein (TIGR02246 family)